MLKGRTFFLGFPFGRLFSSALGDAGDADSRLVGDFDISFTVETTIRTIDVRRLAESFLVALERGFHLILVGRISLQDPILGDQPASTLGQEDFVSELDGLVDLTALDQIGVRFKNRVHLLFGGDLLPLQDTASSLIDNSVTELAVVFDLLAQGPDGYIVQPVDDPDLLGFFQHWARLSHDRLGYADQLSLLEYLWLASLLGRHPLNLLHPAASRAGAVGKATDTLGQQLVQTPYESSDDPDGVPKQRAIGGVVDVSFDDGSIDPQFLTVFQAQSHSGTDQPFIDDFQGLGGEPVKSAVEGVRLTICHVLAARRLTGQPDQSGSSQPRASTSCCPVRVMVYSSPAR